MSLLRVYFKNLFRVNIPQGRVQQQAYDQITYSLNRAFGLPSLREYAATLSIKGLLIKAVEMFVGSRNVPKNIGLSQHLIEVAESRAKNARERDEIQYYKYFFIRIDAFKNGKTDQFDMTSDVINRLAEERQHPQSCVIAKKIQYLAGKQILNVAFTTRDKKEKKQMLKLAAFYFQKSLTESNYGGLYYIGEIYGNQQYSSLEEHQFIQFFAYGAAFGDPLCYFRLSLIYLKRQDIKLYLFYLKLAAQSGVIQAQHNLGCEYLEGKHMNKDEVKALAWFIHAAANGYIESKFNVVQMFSHGSSCGRVKRNPKVALVKLEELKATGEDVDDKIKELLEDQQIRKLYEEQSQRKTKTDVLN